MADISTITASDGVTYNIKDATARNLLTSKRIFKGTCDTAASTGAKVVVCPEYDALTNGDIVFVTFTVTNTAAATSVSLNVNSTGAKNVQVQVGGTRRYINPSFLRAGWTYMCMYDSSNAQWTINMNTDSTVSTMATRKTVSDGGSGYRYIIHLTDVDGKLVPFTNANNAPSTYTKTVTTHSFNPFGDIFFYNSTSTVSAGGSISADFLTKVHTTDARYFINCLSSGGTDEVTRFKSNAAVFIKAKYVYSSGLAYLAPSTDTSNYLAYSSVVQTLPSSDPNGSLNAGEEYIYIYLGIATSQYYIGIDFNHPVYHWNSELSTIENFSASTPEKIVFVSQSSTFSEIYNIKQKGKIPIYKDADGFAFPEQVEDSSPNEFIFTKTTDTGTVAWYKVDSVGTWTSGTTSGGGGSSNLFIATYNTTTYSAISTAKTANKVIVCKPVNINEGYALLTDFEAPSGGGHGISIYQDGFWFLTLQATTIPTTDISVVLHYGTGDETVTIPANEWGNDGTSNHWYCSNLPKDPYEENLTSVTEVGASPASGSATFSSTKGNKIYTYTVDLNDNWSWSSVTVPSASVNATVTLSSSGWSETSAGSGIYYQGVTPSSGGSSIDPLEYSTITVSPQGNPSAYANAGIWCDSASYYLLNFRCTSVPTTNIVVNVVLT